MVALWSSAARRSRGGVWLNTATVSADGGTPGIGAIVVTNAGCAQLRPIHRLLGMRCMHKAFSMPRSGYRIVIAALLLATGTGAQAQTRAWLDRDRIASGETATLNIQTDQPAASAPDYSPLLPDFVLSGNTSRREFELVNGVSRTRLLFAVALQPRREGVIGIPALRIGNRTTQPLTLTVTPAAIAPRRGGVVFIEGEADDHDPWVQQAVGYVVRLYYAVPLISGQLDQDAPDGATLQRVGEDLQYQRELGGRRYTVVERRYLLIPERSGTLTLPGARFQGRGAGGFFDELFGDGQRDLRARGAPRLLQVRPAPANAPQPWLPLRALSLRYLATPQAARAGEAVTITIEATADGASAAQLPELGLAVGSGAQVFAEPAQADETFVAGRPQVRIARKFQLVPAQAGALRIPGPRLQWWDVRAGIVRTASLPDLNLQVSPGAGGFGAPAGPAPGTDDAVDSAWMRVPGVQGEIRPWALATVFFAALWLVTLTWGLHRRPDARAVVATGSGEPAPSSAKTLRDLRRALDAGDPGEVAEVLCALASPPAPDLDALQARLADAAQRDAVQMLQRARWGDGDPAVARGAVREAFRGGPRWHLPEVVADGPLPPLYPS